MRNCLYLLFCLIIFNSCKKDAVAPFTVINSGMSGNTAASLLARINDDVISEKPNLVIVMVGTNEAIFGDTTYTHFQRNLTRIVTKIQSAGAQVLLLTPPPITSKFNANLNLPRLDTVCATVRTVSQLTGCQFIDNFANINAVLHAYIAPAIYNSDGIHLISDGYADMTEPIYQYLKDKVTKGEKIICFGDSLTFGLYVQGAGTVSGQTYPADLNRELNTAYFASHAN
jgi:lysophospholipase L1-like esterase